MRVRLLPLLVLLAGCGTPRVSPQPAVEEAAAAQPAAPQPAAASAWVALAESDRVVISFDSAGARRTPEGHFAVRLRWTLATPHAPDDTEPFAYDTYEADRDVDCATRTERSGDAAWYLNGAQVRFAMGLGHEGAALPGSIGARAIDALCRRLGGA